MASGLEFVQQAAVIPVREGHVCLVTARSGKRWVIPKGSLEPGMTAGQVSLKEAWEEAGLVGVLRREPFGSYSYEKLGLTHHVTVFVMQVTEAAEVWPECLDRRRCWLTPEEAQEQVSQPGLSELLRAIPAELLYAAGADLDNRRALPASPP
jgi:8-oxo-dGTP pyrophosphatase MutT (NUDIX family)